MKFLMTLFQIQDYGGIINHAENLALGMKELGHEIDFCILAPKKEVVRRHTVPKDIHQYRKLGTGYRFHQARGWYGLPKIPYLSSYHRSLFKEKCGKYDAVLWHIPVPTMSKENKNIDQWLDLYDHGTKNIAIIHDGNMPELYPHMLKVAEHFDSCVCVHESAFNSSEVLPIPRKLIVNPFDLSNSAEEDYSTRNGFAAIQVFKGWKRVDSLIKAIPHMLRGQRKIVGGEGIEYRYMTSKDKCKDKYFYEDGSRIWDVALEHGMKHIGTVPNEEVLEILKKVRLQIDPSYSKKYSEFGAHFNRTTVEAMICGAVPVATDWGMKNSKIFKPNENYIEIPAGCESKVFAEIINNGLTDSVLWHKIRDNNRSLIQMFDQKTVASEYVSLVEGKSNTTIGKTSEKTIAKCNKNLDFFSVGHIDAIR